MGNMRIKNPSNWDVAVWGVDSYSEIRDYCTCPGCQTVWGHKETGNFRDDAKAARERYSAPTKCGDCGLVTEAIPKQSFWESMRGEYRRTVDRKRERDEEVER